MTKFSSDIEESIVDDLDTNYTDFKVVSGTVQIDNFDYPSIHVIQGESNHKKDTQYDVRIPIEIYLERDADSGQKDVLEKEKTIENIIDDILASISSYNDVVHYRVERIDPLIGEINNKMFVGSQVEFLAVRKINLHRRS